MEVNFARSLYFHKIMSNIMGTDFDTAWNCFNRKPKYKCRYDSSKSQVELKTNHFCIAWEKQIKTSFPRFRHILPSLQTNFRRFISWQVSNLEPPGLWNSKYQTILSPDFQRRSRFIRSIKLQDFEKFRFSLILSLSQFECVKLLKSDLNSCKDYVSVCKILNIIVVKLEM